MKPGSLGPSQQVFDNSNGHVSDQTGVLYYDVLGFLAISVSRSRNGRKMCDDTCDGPISIWHGEYDGATRKAGVDVGCAVC